MVPDPNTGMWKVYTRNAQDIAVRLHTIYRAAQLIYIASHRIDPANIKPNQSYDKFHAFYVSKFADCHACILTASIAREVLDFNSYFLAHCTFLAPVLLIFHLHTENNSYFTSICESFKMPFICTTLSQ